MKYLSQKMNMNNAVKISKWCYEKPYDFYDSKPSDEFFDELLNTNYYSIHKDGELIGFYCSGKEAQVPTKTSMQFYESQDYIDFGLGMRPDLTGQKNGRDFVGFITECIQNANPDKKLRLTVASFNKRAQKLYENLGFRFLGEFITNGTNIAFIVMIKDS